MHDDTEHEEHETKSGGMNLADIYFVLFRQKWKILLCSLMGIVGAVALFLVKPPLWQSEAKIYIKYITDSRPTAPPGTDTAAISLNQHYENIIATETEILKSLDLAEDVARKIGAARILGKDGGTNNDAAAVTVLRNLLIEGTPKGSVIPIVFQHQDPQVAQDVLREIIATYSKLHTKLHMPATLHGDSLAQETKRVQDELAETERKLKEAKTEAGVTAALEDAKKAKADGIAKIQQDLFDAEARLVEHQATLKDLPQGATAGADSTNTPAMVPPETIKQYQRTAALLSQFLQKEAEYLVSFTETSGIVKDLRERIKAVEASQKKMEAEHPGLTNVATAISKTGQPAANAIDPAAEAALVRSLESKVTILRSQLAQIQKEAAKINEMEPTIIDLQRSKNFLEDRLKYYVNGLNKAETEGALNAEQAPNIGNVQSPTPAGKKWSKKFQKMLAAVVLGPVVFGIALAFFIELFLDRSVKRSKEIETQLGLPLFLTIPDLNGNERPRRLGSGRRNQLLLGNGSGETHSGRNGDGPKTAEAEVVSWDARNELRPFYEALRDRLVTFFESKHQTRNPKLVAVTSCDEGCGVTTIAAGLAATLSEIGEGNVLLVDMKRKQESAAHLFFKGDIECGLDSALKNETRTEAQVQDNLYVVTEAADTDKLTRTMPKRFAHLLPQLKSSDYEYVIFDMPPVSQISVTHKLSRFMDINLLVVEAEKTDRDVVKKASSMLGSTLGNLGVVLNKKQTHVPEWLVQEL